MAAAAGAPLAAVCTSFLSLPHEELVPLPVRAVLYTLGMLYCFLGLGIIATKYMDAMDNIVRQTRTVRYRDADLGIIVTREERIWNPTIADITLLALGTSAPPISLAIISSIRQLGVPSTGSDVGIGTMLGGASFNFFAILACCILIPQNGVTKRVANFGVFLVELAWSIWAYIWLFIVFQVWTPGEVTLLEGVLTVLHMPLLMLHAYAQDQQWPCLSLPCSVTSSNSPDRPALRHSSLADSSDRLSLLAPGHKASDLYPQLLPLPLPGARGACTSGEMPSAEYRDPAEFEPETYSQLDGDGPRGCLGIRGGQGDSSQVGGLAGAMMLVPPQLQALRPYGSSPLRYGKRREGPPLQSPGVMSSSSGSDLSVGSPELGWTESSDSTCPSMPQLSLTSKSPSPSRSPPGDREVSPAVAVRLAGRSCSADSEMGGEGPDLRAVVLGLSRLMETPQASENKRALGEGAFTREGVHVPGPSCGDSWGAAELFVTEPGMRRRGPHAEEGGALHEGSSTWAGAYAGPFGDEELGAAPEGVHFPRELSVSDSELHGRPRGPFSGEPASELRRNTGEGLDPGPPLPHPGWSVLAPAGARRGLRPGARGSSQIMGQPPRGAVSLPTSPNGRLSAGSLRQQWRRQICEALNIQTRSPALKALPPKGDGVCEEGRSDPTLAAVVSCRSSDVACRMHGAAGLGNYLASSTAPWSGAEDDDKENSANPHSCGCSGALLGCWHGLSYFWRVLFALVVPPAEAASGWPAFLTSIGIISVISMLVIELANLLGCVTGIDSFVISLVLLASGTSVPNIIASAIAAHQSPTADSAIANVNASNSINVYLGLGLPWVITASYNNMFLDLSYTIDSSTLGPSLIVYFGTILVGLALLFARRWLVGGELGGHRPTAAASSVALMALWATYCALSMLLFFHIL